MINSIGNSLANLQGPTTDKLVSIGKSCVSALLDPKGNSKSIAAKVTAFALLIFAAYTTFKLINHTCSAINKYSKGKAVQTDASRIERAPTKPVAASISPSSVAIPPSAPVNPAPVGQAASSSSEAPSSQRIVTTRHEAFELNTSAQADSAASSSAPSASAASSAPVLFGSGATFSSVW